MPDMNGDPVPHPTDETPDESPADTPEATASAPTPGHRLSADLTVGGRVVVRYRLADGAAAGATDFVGSLVARNHDFLIVDTRTERVKLIRSKVIADNKAKVLPMSKEHLTAWRTAMQPVWKKFEGDVGADLIQAAQKANK